MYRIISILVLLMATADVRGESSPSSADVRDLTRVRAYERARVDLIEQIRPATACIFPEDSRQGGGSGVVIDDDGYGLTNFHVVAGMMEKRKGQAGFDDQRLYDIEVLGVDPAGDVAMFRVLERKPMPYAELGHSSELRVGDFALAIGNPFLLAEDFVPTVTLGIISGLHRYQAGAGPRGRALRYTDCIQVDTSINPGNSGGPLFDMTGRVVGINGRVSIEERGRVNVGVGYAISIDQIRRFIPALRAGITTAHATAGFTVHDRRGVVVVDQILDDSPAYQAGVRLGDALLEFDGSKIVSSNQFGSLLGTYPDKWPVTVRLARREAEQRGESVMGFRLEAQPQPADVTHVPDGAPNLLAPHPVTTAANRRAAKRLWNLHRSFIGAEDMVTQIGRLQLEGTRRLTQGNVTKKERVTESEEDAGLPADVALIKPVDVERIIRWLLLKPFERIDIDAIEVVGGDQIDERVCGVVNLQYGGLPEVELTFDEFDGRLLRMGFDDRVTGRPVLVHYSDFKKDSGFRWAHGREMTVSGAAITVQYQFTAIRATDD